MNNEVIRDWVEALRSGRYVQGRERLVSLDYEGNEEFCCLGVLCQMAIEANVDDLEYDGDSTEGYGTFNGEEAFLPGAVMRWVGFDTASPEVTVELDEEGSRQELVELNDQGWTFEQLAELIEREWLKEEANG